MKRLLLAVLICLLICNVAWAGPAPNAKQLRIGLLGSGDDDFDEVSRSYHTAAWTWIAQRYGWYSGDQRGQLCVDPGCSYASWFVNGLNRTEVDFMKGVNPNMKITKYDLFSPPVSDVRTCNGSPLTCYNIYKPQDTVLMKAYAASRGLPMDSFVLMVPPGQSITFTQEYRDPATNAVTKYPGLVTTAGATARMGRWLMFSANDTAIMHDPRSNYWGHYLAHKWDSVCAALNIDGIFGDNYGSFGHTGLMAVGESRQSMQWPYPEVLNYDGTSLITSGFNNFTKPFPGAVVANLRAWQDSLRSWDTTRWFKAMCDSFVVAKGRIHFMNTDGNGGGRAGYYSQYALDVAPMARLARSTFQGEGGYQFPSDGSFYDDCRNGLYVFKDAREFCKDYGQGWIRVGPTANNSLDRNQLTALGYMLELQALNKPLANPYTNTVEIYYLPCLFQYQTDWFWLVANRVAVKGSAYSGFPDTLSLWNDAWGKYFGESWGAMDTSGTLLTTQVSNDPQGQPFKLDVCTLLRPGTVNTLTLVIGRLARGTTSYDSAATSVNVTMPAGTWYPLRSTNHVVRWGTPISGGSVIKIANGHFQIFSSDTVLSNNGPSPDTSISINDASVTEGGTETFTVTLSTVLATNFIFTVNTAGVTATNGVDYTAVTSRIDTILAGQLSKTITVATTQDANYEPDETFTVTLSSPSIGTISRAVGTGTIVNDDIPVLSIGNASATEGGALTFTISLSFAVVPNITFMVSTASGTATSGIDFTALNQTYTIASGSTSTTVTVQSTQDANVEANETFTVTISSPSFGTIGTAVGTGTIVNDDSTTSNNGQTVKVKK